MREKKESARLRWREKREREAFDPNGIGPIFSVFAFILAFRKIEQRSLKFCILKYENYSLRPRWFDNRLAVKSLGYDLKICQELVNTF